MSNNTNTEKFNIAHAALDRHRGSGISDKEAMVFISENADPIKYTYKDLIDEVSAFAGVLKANGIKKGDTVMIRLANCPWFPVAFFASLKLGAIPVPSSMLLAADEVVYLTKDSGARIVVTQPDLWDDIAETFEKEVSDATVIMTDPFGNGMQTTLKGDHILNLKTELEKSQPVEECLDTDANDPAYLVYTSGTTGFPKGVLHAHRSMLGREPAAKHWFDFIDDERILHSGKFNWTYVLGTAMMDPLYQGKTVVVFDGKNDAGGWIRLIAEQRCTTFIGVPTIYRQILQKTECNKDDVPTLRHCMCAGEHLSEPVLAAWRERFGINIYEGLGMSECSYYISQSPQDEIRPGSAGKVQPGHIVELMDEDMNPVEPGEEGVLSINRKDKGLFLKYWKLPEQTEKVFKGDWFVTGDYAIRDREGYIKFLGRRDDIIKSFGYRISPYEIERVMKGHPNIAECVAIGETIAQDKTLVTLCVVMKPGTEATEEELLNWTKGHLADYKRPKKVRFMDSFPRTANGKILRKKILPVS